MIDKSSDVIMAQIGHLWQEFQRVKAQNEVLLKLVAQQQGLDLKELSKEVESCFAKNLLSNKKTFDKVINDASGYNPSQHQ
jgi:hypothetical protein